MNQSRRATLLSFAALGLTLLVVLGGAIRWWLVRRELSEALRPALSEGDYAAIRALVRRGADVNTIDNPEYGDHGITALEEAVSHHDVQFVRELLARGARVDPETVEGITPLLTAAGSAPLRVLETLLQAGADSNHQNSNGYTPLIAAAEAGDVDAVRLLLQAGAQANLANRYGKTALDYAKPNVAPLLRAATRTSAPAPGTRP